MEKSNFTYSEERFHSVFATKMREEFLRSPDDVKQLAEFLHCSPQAINQFKLGQALPKVERLIKIAQFYNCSLDYLIGTSDVRSSNATIQEICDYTGLSEKAVDLLHNMKVENRVAIMPLFESKELESVGGFLKFAIFAISKVKPEDRTLWAIEDIPKTIFLDDGTIQTVSTPKEAARQFLKEAQEYLCSILEMAIVSIWNNNKKGNNNGKHK